MIRELPQRKEAVQSPREPWYYTLACVLETLYIRSSVAEGLLLVLGHEEVGILDGGWLWQIQLTRLLGRWGGFRLGLRLGWGGLWLGVQLDGHVWLARPRLIT